MTRLPQVKPQDLIKSLEKCGFKTTRMSGSHARLVHQDGRKATVPIHKRPLPKGTLKSILRQAKVSLSDLKS